MSNGGSWQQKGHGRRDT